jgi:hypothetical protein
VRQRSAYVQRLLEDALPREDDDADPLYLAALDVERDERLAWEMLEWDVAAADGLADHLPKMACGDERAAA